MRSLRRFLVLITALAAVVAMAACGSDSDNAETTTTSTTAAGGSNGSTPPEEVTLRLGTGKFANTAPQVVNPEIFAEQGITLDITYAQSGAAVVPGVVGGSYDIGYGSAVAVVQAVEQGVPIKMIATADISVGSLVVLADSGIETASDLEGKTIATNALKTTVDFETRVVVDEKGGDASKLTFIEVPFPAQLAALDSGNIAAAVLPEPFLSQAAADPKYKVLFSIFDIKDPNLTNCYFASVSFLEKSPDVAERFVTAILESNAYALANPDKAREAVSQITEAPLAAIANIELPAWITEPIDEKQVERLIDRMAQWDMIAKKPPVADVIWSKS